VITKDADFVGILERLGPPPQIIWLTCGNASKAHLMQLFQRSMKFSLEDLERGEPLVEIG
jgi:predicted nuclease of predicted toxin-antitoxin system